MESSGGEFIGADMILGEICLILQKPVIFQACLLPGGIPGSIHVIVAAAQLHNIPGVGAGAGIGNTRSADNSAVYTQFQGQTVEQIGIALADSRPVHQRRIGGVHQQIAVIFQIVIVISNIGAHPVVDAADLFIIALAIQIQLAQQRRHSGIHNILLLLGVAVRKVISKDHIVIAGRIVLTIYSTAIAGILILQVITRSRISVMFHGAIENLVPHCREILVCCFNIDQHLGQAGLHTLPESRFGLRNGAVDRGCKQCSRLPFLGRLRNGDLTGIQGIHPEGNLDTGHSSMLLRCRRGSIKSLHFLLRHNDFRDVFLRESTYRQQRAYHNQAQQQSHHTFEHIRSSSGNVSFQKEAAVMYLLYDSTHRYAMEILHKIWQRNFIFPPISSA